MITMVFMNYARLSIYSLSCLSCSLISVRCLSVRKPDYTHTLEGSVRVAFTSKKVGRRGPPIG